jgi:ATP/ADP translocase
MTDLPKKTRRSITVATVASTAMIAQQVAGKAVRDGFFLSNFPATDLPKAMIGGAILSFIGALILSRVLSRLGPRRVTPLLFSLSAVLFLAFWAFHAQNPAIITVLLYLHMASLGILVISSFWSLINERFDPHTTKRAIGRIVSGATFGGILGGILADRVPALFDLGSMFLVLAALHSVCALVLLDFGGNDRVEKGSKRLPHGFAVIRRSAYLKQVALVVALASGLGALLDYAMKVEAAEHFANADSLVSFFAAFYTVTGVLTFAVQRGLGSRTLRRIGLGATMSVLPVAALLGGALAAFFTRLATTVAAKGAELILANSFFRSGVELLYAPVPPSRKRAAKAIVDVIAQRTGDLLGGGFILLVIALLPAAADKIVLISACVLAVLGIVTLARLQHGYIAELTASLKRGLISIDVSDAVDSATERALAGVREPDAEIPRAAAIPAVPHLDLLDATAALISGDPMQQRRALADQRLDPRVASHIIPLLGDDRLRDAAIVALRRIGPHITGQLVDALIGSEHTIEIRIQLPRLLEEIGGRRGANALLLTLSDAPFEVRYHAGKALARLGARDPSLAPAPERIFQIARAELDTSPEVWARHDGILDQADAGPLEAEIARRAGPGVEHLFSLFSLVLDRDAVEIALRGWLSDDVRMRGTAIEYFENVLPESLRRALAERLPILREHSARIRGS